MRKKIFALLLLLFSLTLTSCVFDVPEEDIPDIEEEEVPTEKTMKQLREEALIEISTYILDTSKYRSEQVAEINSIVGEYTEKLNKCKDKTLISGIVNECKNKLDMVKTDEQLTREEQEAEDSKTYKTYYYMNKQDHYDILMVGSSYLYYYDQYKLLENVLDDKGFDVNIEEVVKSSTPLETFNDSTDELYETLQNKLSSKQYEYIFLEELSTRPIKNYDKFESAVGRLLERINATQNNCEVILFEVWARDERCDWYNENPTYTYDSMEEALARAYKQCGDKYNLRGEKNGK